MNKRVVMLLTVLLCLAVLAPAMAEEAQPGTLNVLKELNSANRDGSVVIGLTGTYPILDYTYYDYDPETFVVDLADVDVSQLPKVLDVNSGSVTTVKVEPISRAKGRSLAKLEIHKGYLAKCLVSSEGNRLTVRVVGAGEAPPPAPAPAPAPKAAPVAEKAPAAPAAEVAAAPAPAPAPASKVETAARNLTGVSVAAGGSEVRLTADGAAKPKYFALTNPDRIVVDLPGVGRGTVPSRTAGQGNVQQVRVSLFQAAPVVTRVVVDLTKGEKAFAVSSAGAEVVVRLGEAPETAKAEAPQLPASAGPAQAEAAAAPSPEAAAPVELAKASEPAPASSPEAPAAPAEKGKAEAPRPAPAEPVKVELKPLDPAASREFKGYEDLFVAQDTSAPAPEGKAMVAGGVPLSFKEKTIAGGGTKYSGEPISLSLKDADVKDVLRVFHDISKMNIVVHPAVQGKVTVDLENVPWDQAMDIVLKNNGLDYVYENNVIWVAPAAEIARKFADVQRLQKEKLNSEQTVTFTQRLSYAKAGNMVNIAKRFMSDRGNIIVDDRTNTMIIEEVPSKKEGLMKLINSLDTATPQVLIEARIVETTISWDQSFGIVWSGNWYTSRTGNQYVTTNQGTAPTGSNTAALHNLNNSTGWPNSGTGDFAVPLPPSASNGFIDLVLGNTSGSFFLDVRLAAMENAGRGRVVSAPRIVTQDNEKASIETGRQIPIRIATADKLSVVFVNATLKLDVTPQISADGNVNMVVDVTNDSVDFAHQEPGNPPPILKKEAKTSLKVKDGATAVIGGVFVTNEGISQSGLPFLSKIPVLGWLFKNRTKNRSNEELLIFLTPKIVR